MKKTYDFSKGKRGAVVPAGTNKVRITIRLDRQILDYFRSKVEVSGGGNYQTLINDSLKKMIQNEEELSETSLRRIIREELKRTM